MNQEAEIDDVQFLLRHFRVCQDLAASTVEHLKFAGQVFSQPDRQMKVMGQILALHAALDALEFLLLNERGRAHLLEPLRKLGAELESRLPGRRPLEKGNFLRILAVEMVEILSNRGGMAVGEARRYVARELTRGGLSRQSPGKDRDNPRSITAGTLKGWQDRIGGRRDPLPEVSEEDARGFVDHTLRHALPRILRPASE
jgi:hypothetical protein